MQGFTVLEQCDQKDHLTGADLINLLASCQELKIWTEVIIN